MAEKNIRIRGCSRFVSALFSPPKSPNDDGHADYLLPWALNLSAKKGRNLNKLLKGRSLGHNFCEFSGWESERLQINRM